MQKKAFYSIIVLTGLISITWVFFPDSAPIPDTPTVSNINAIDPLAASSPATNTLIGNNSTIATAWQWQESNDDQTNINDLPNIATDNQRSWPFTQESVYKALHAVKLDDNGDIIIDHDTLIALNAALNHSQLELDGETLEDLQELIRTGLPGEAGEQTAQIVADYYLYLRAKNEFNSLYEANDIDQTNSGEPQKIESNEAQYNELMALRELYLGAENAEKLFSIANANSRYMFDSMKLEADINLSEEEKTQQQELIIKRHTEQTVKVDNWQERHRSFANEKKHILNASLSDDEKREQLTELLHQRFSPEELVYIDHLQLDSP
jgi:lipase chaperone LimK